MIPVTQFVKNARQPAGGYIPPSELVVVQHPCEEQLRPENLPPTIIGLVVDYLTRYELEGDLLSAFHVSYQGAQMLGETDVAEVLLNQITSLDDLSIISACHLVAYDSYARSGVQQRIDNPDADTIYNIRVMVERSVKFFSDVVVYGLQFYPTGRHGIKGDCDYITKDTLWDMKVSKYAPTAQHTFQLLIYHTLMYLHYEHLSLRVNNIGIFNPRLNTSYTYDISKLKQEYIFEVLDYVL